VLQVLTPLALLVVVDHSFIGNDCLEHEISVTLTDTQR
jgi:hypothetical protein